MQQLHRNRHVLLPCPETEMVRRADNAPHILLTSPLPALPASTGAGVRLVLYPHLPHGKTAPQLQAGRLMAQAGAVAFPAFSFFH